MPPEQNDTPAPGSGAKGRPGMKGENGLPSWAVWILVGVVRHARFQHDAPSLLYRGGTYGTFDAGTGR